MSEDFSPSENQIATAHYGVPGLWAASVDRACTRWLKARGLLASQEEPLRAARLKAAATRRRNLLARESDEDDAPEA